MEEKTKTKETYLNYSLDNFFKEIKLGYNNGVSYIPAIDIDNMLIPFNYSNNTKKVSFENLKDTLDNVVFDKANAVWKSIEFSLRSQLENNKESEIYLVIGSVALTQNPRLKQYIFEKIKHMIPELKDRLHIISSSDSFFTKNGTLEDVNNIKKEELEILKLQILEGRKELISEGKIIKGKREQDKLDFLRNLYKNDKGFKSMRKGEIIDEKYLRLPENSKIIFMDNDMYHLKLYEKEDKIIKLPISQELCILSEVDDIYERSKKERVTKELDDTLKEVNFLVLNQRTENTIKVLDSVKFKKMEDLEKIRPEDFKKANYTAESFKFVDNINDIIAKDINKRIEMHLDLRNVEVFKDMIKYSLHTISKRIKNRDIDYENLAEIFKSEDKAPSILSREDVKHLRERLKLGYNSNFSVDYETIIIGFILKDMFEELKDLKNVIPSNKFLAKKIEEFFIKNQKRYDLDLINLERDNKEFNKSSKELDILNNTERLRTESLHLNQIKSKEGPTPPKERRRQIFVSPSYSTLNIQERKNKNDEIYKKVETNKSEERIQSLNELRDGRIRR